MKLSVLIAGLAMVASVAEAGTCGAHLASLSVFSECLRCACCHFSYAYSIRHTLTPSPSPSPSPFALRLAL